MRVVHMLTSHGKAAKPLLAAHAVAWQSSVHTGLCIKQGQEYGLTDVFLMLSMGGGNSQH